MQTDKLTADAVKARTENFKGSTAPAKLNLQKFRELNTQMAVEGFKCYENQPLTYWTTALAGEIGELCNMIKKMQRVSLGGIDGGSSYTAKDITPQMLKEEIGGIAIYLDLLASLLKIDLEDAIIETFNSKSDKYNFQQYITPETVQPSKGEPPLKAFAQQMFIAENPKDSFSIGNEKFKEGDRVYGTWVNIDGRTYGTEGIIIRNESTGLWVEDAGGGITEVKLFWMLHHKK